MLRLIYLVSFFGLVAQYLAEYRQEHSVGVCNDKYFSYCNTLTKRTGRGTLYRTNITFTSIDDANNNVTVVLSLGTKTQIVATLKKKLCDMFKTKWYYNYLKTYSNLTLVCPLRANTYLFRNMVFPPKDFPLEFPKTDITMYLHFILEVTETEEEMARFTILLRG